jgi:1-deoxy-D-xylulose-5-phosphate synthase
MPVLHLGLPDRFVDHGKHIEQLTDTGLDSTNILQSIEQRLELLKTAGQVAQI